MQQNICIVFSKGGFLSYQLTYLFIVYQQSYNSMVKKNWNTFLSHSPVIVFIVFLHHQSGKCMNKRKFGLHEPLWTINESRLLREAYRTSSFCLFCFVLQTPQEPPLSSVSRINCLSSVCFLTNSYSGTWTFSTQNFLQNFSIVQRVNNLLALWWLVCLKY